MWSWVFCTREPTERGNPCKKRWFPFEKSLWFFDDIHVKFTFMPVAALTHGWIEQIFGDNGRVIKYARTPRQREKCILRKYNLKRRKVLRTGSRKCYFSLFPVHSAHGGLEVSACLSWAVIWLQKMSLKLPRNWDFSTFKENSRIGNKSTHSIIISNAIK